ncbi:hypothetical protein DRO42_02350 [Candidatus Bathyarchaeota archaeon]|nr:MAG: hypothetical protein DRO42_02350 [Candidatus Bathyarchaeota archaeon]
MTTPARDEDRMRADSFFQRPSFNAKERLICSHLIETINAKPLETVLHVTRAALLLDPDTRARLSIDGKQMRGLFSVAYRLANPAIKPDHSGKTYRVSLRNLDHKRLVKPWFKEHVMVKLPESDMEKHVELLKSMSFESRVQWITDRMSEVGYHTLVGCFLDWCMARVQETAGKLATTISPETYGELFRMVTERRRRADT